MRIRIFSDCDHICQCDSFGTFSHEQDRLFWKYVHKEKWQLLFYKKICSIFCCYTPSWVWKGTERKPGGIEVGLKYAGFKIGFLLHLTSLKVINTWFYQGWMSREPSLEGKEITISWAPSAGRGLPPQPLWKLINSMMARDGKKWAIPKIVAHRHYYG